MNGAGSGPSAKRLRHSALIHRGRSLTPHDQSPALKLVSTHSTKAVDGMLSVSFWRLVHDQAEMVSALRTVSSDVFSHQPDSYRRIRLSRKANLEQVNSRLADDLIDRIRHSNDNRYPFLANITQLVSHNSTGSIDSLTRQSTPNDKTPNTMTVYSS
jgi:hypothetical protein